MRQPESRPESLRHGSPKTVRLLSAWRGRRIVVVRVFSKKTQTTPRREINLAIQRASELTICTKAG